MSEYSPEQQEALEQTRRLHEEANLAAERANARAYPRVVVGPADGDARPQPREPNPPPAASGLRHMVARLPIFVRGELVPAGGEVWLLRRSSERAEEAGLIEEPRPLGATRPYVVLLEYADGLDSPIRRAGSIVRLAPDEGDVLMGEGIVRPLEQPKVKRSRKRA